MTASHDRLGLTGLGRDNQEVGKTRITFSLSHLVCFWVLDPL